MITSTSPLNKLSLQVDYIQKKKINPNYLIINNTKMKMNSTKIKKEFL